MRGLLLGATIVLALIVGVLAAGAAHAEGPETTEEEAFVQLVLAGAPLPVEPLSATPTSGPVTSSALPSSMASPSTAPPVAPAAETALPPQLGPPVALQLPDIPNLLDWFDNLDPRKWAGDILNAVLTTIGKALLEAVRGFVDWALGFGDSSLNFVTRTPAEGSYGSPTVRALWDFSRTIVNVLLAVIVMCLHGVGQGHNAAEGLPGKVPGLRLVLCLSTDRPPCALPLARRDDHARRGAPHR